jgi:D-arabinose 1-dehydrogenase-like Zn-dependent alcohol dehydrogenase
VTNAKAMFSFIGGLSVNGKLIIIGAPNEPLEVPIFPLLTGRQSIIGWYSGTSIDLQDTLSFSALSGVRSLNETFPLEKVSETYDLMINGKARFRAVLTM